MNKLRHTERSLYFGRHDNVGIMDYSKSSNKRKSGFLILGYNLYFIGLFLLVAKKWAQDRFPMHTPEIVFYTLKYAKGNYDPSIIAEVVKIVLASFFTSFVLFLSVLIIELNLFRLGYLLTEEQNLIYI